MDCWYCGQKGQSDSECWKKHGDLEKSVSGKADRGSRQSSHYREESEKSDSGNRISPTFLMRHNVDSMKTTSRLEEV